MRYLDQAGARLERRYSGEFDSLVEATRIGHLTATDPKALARWRSLQGRHQVATGTPGDGSIGLSGAALERTILGLAMTHPDLVRVVGVAA